MILGRILDTYFEQWWPSVPWPSKTAKRWQLLTPRFSLIIKQSWLGLSITLLNPFFEWTAYLMIGIMSSASVSFKDDLHTKDLLDSQY